MTQGELPYVSQPIRADLAPVLQQLRPGVKIEVTHTIKVGSTKTWQTTVRGTFRQLDSLATGLATERRPQDDVIIPVIHFTKDNGELSSVTLDQNTLVKIVP
ncbi:MAG: hypothetical protein U0793_21790 [Gemmataceae bacterium]|mgnify:CR=1 FL=1